MGGSTAKPITANASPTKMDGFTLSPPVTSTSRRGHAHRRSGALSQHDLSAILKPGGQSNAGSAPNTPSQPAFRKPSQPELTRSSSDFGPSSSHGPGVPSDDGSEMTQGRTRVTFSNDPEFIPRPLSTISSETSSSMSTVRAGHSVTGSISSLASGGTSSPPSAKRTKSASLLLSDLESLRSRPQGVGHSKRLPSTDERFRDAQLPESPAETPSPLADQTSESGAQGNQESTGALLSPTDDAESVKVDVSPSPSSNDPTPFASAFEPRLRQPILHDFTAQRPRTSPAPRCSQPTRNAKSLKGLVLPRKPRQSFPTSNSGEHSASPSPCEENHTGTSFSLDDVTFDEDTTCIIESAPPKTSHSWDMPMRVPEWTARDLELPLEDGGNILDIDAALGEPDRPSSRNTSSDFGTSFPLAKRKMHSSGEMGGFTGPGMHYHRRADSAPELDAFEQGRLGFTHRASNPTMTEAIEEEEEDDEEANKVSEHTEEQEPTLGVHIVEARLSDEQPVRLRRRPRGQPEDSDTKPAQISDTGANSGLDSTRLGLVDEQPRLSVITKSSDELSITPTLSANPALSQLTTVYPHLVEQTSRSNLNTPQTPYALPSPDYSKASFDAHDPLRVHTAHSSITDRTTLNSARTGDHGLGSVDDVPSLTSSASTMISGHPARFSSSGTTTESFADRSFSLSNTAPARIRSGTSSKRSSLVSLSRLVGSTYNKSKLNIAELAPADTPEKPEKKKGKRISRLKFWKTKERQSPS